MMSESRASETWGYVQRALNFARQTFEAHGDKGRADLIHNYMLTFEQYAQSHARELREANGKHLNGNGTGDPIVSPGKSCNSLGHVASANGKSVDTALHASGHAAQAPVLRDDTQRPPAEVRPEVAPQAAGSPVSTNTEVARVGDQADGAAELAKDIESQIGGVVWMMTADNFKTLPSVDQQRFEVAQAKLCRARGYILSGQIKQAKRQYDSAMGHIRGEENEYAEG